MPTSTPGVNLNLAQISSEWIYSVAAAKDIYIYIYLYILYIYIYIVGWILNYTENNIALEDLIENELNDGEWRSRTKEVN